MEDTFTLLDLVSQAVAVQRLLRGRSEGDKLAWLGARGELNRVDVRFPGARAVFAFESVLGLRCLFFIDGDRFVFLGDQTTYTVRDFCDEQLAG